MTRGYHREGTFHIIARSDSDVATYQIVSLMLVMTRKKGLVMTVENRLAIIK